ncbi:glycolipid sulfotransferase [Mycobacterium kiyosense]|uniref:Glycolipid sulfotransferase n=1 Tax=Mycobacterium kiyosense TaxID=2871094 RepID=A0A9P3QA20_9MYCO|nr:glycolipid sulfotransferase [Mycobacterium sp. 20KCMC460]GLB86622.1 glycolipid sulfotransferase [Mycobacterium kiyosense]GLB91445.1 glycolipid sulfotransferase [Mycobacterium kiyosense]GLB98595.1 glycolipid sulfotransferase [Mycobacterium kiyosense]GLC03903.1 glycolipid sulfotransferase [Mycobacterium kiyosense]
MNRVPYRSLMSDNTRWDALELRPGDIIITTPSKCGMTWMQRLVSLLVFDGPDLPGPLSTVSPWFDQTIRPVQEVAAVLEAQRHRRFIKTHTPLDGLVLDDRVTYICVGRDPRDAAVSMLHQTTNMDRDRVRELYDAAAPATGRPGRPDRVPEPGHGPRGPVAEFRDWMEGPAHPPPGVGLAPPRGIGTLANILDQFGKSWERRHAPNVALFHYADLQADLVGELLLLASTLGIDLTRERAQELAAYASLDAMRSRASEIAPNTTDGIWRSDERFFRRGGSGEWQQYFGFHETRRYNHRINQLAPPDLLAWAHEGRRGCDPTG